MNAPVLDQRGTDHHHALTTTLGSPSSWATRVSRALPLPPLGSDVGWLGLGICANARVLKLVTPHHHLQGVDIGATRAVACKSGAVASKTLST